MNHAPHISLFKSPIPSTGEGVTAFSPAATVSAINPRFAAVFLYLSGIAQHTYSNLTNRLHAFSSKPFVSTLTSWNLEEKFVLELPRNSVIGAQIDE